MEMKELCSNFSFFPFASLQLRILEEEHYSAYDVSQKV